MTKRYRKPRPAPKWKPRRLKDRRARPPHGPTTTVRFYAGQYTADELALIAASLQDLNVDNEVWLQRVLNLRLLNVANDLRPAAATEADDLGTAPAEVSAALDVAADDASDDQPPPADTALKHLVRVAVALATGTGRMARLLRDRRVLSGEAIDGLGATLNAALEEWAGILGGGSPE